MLLYLILLLIVVQLILFVRKSTRDIDVQIAAYENQKIIVGNQHHVAEALIDILKMTHGTNNKLKREEFLANMQLPKVKDLPN